MIFQFFLDGEVDGTPRPVAQPGGDYSKIEEIDFRRLVKGNEDVHVAPRSRLIPGQRPENPGMRHAKPAQLISMSAQNVKDVIQTWAFYIHGQRITRFCAVCIPAYFGGIKEVIKGLYPLIVLFFEGFFTDGYEFWHQISGLIICIFEHSKCG